MKLELTVVKFNQQYMNCSAQTSNEILVTFKVPENIEVSLGDNLLISDFKMDSDNKMTHLESNSEINLLIKSNDVHDLRLPIKHGRSRTPTYERIFEK